eukprot:scpid102986/ scgid2074/ Bis(5&apos; AP3A hydrolase; Diadenosine 5&apos; Dinucleosidetriphosphatase; Fragile histidine triad protein
MVQDVLVSPRRVAPRFCDLTAEEVSDLFLTSQRVARVVEKEYNGTSLTVSVQDGPDAGQSVPHVHVHILPRKAGDFKRNDDIYTELEGHDKTPSTDVFRSIDDMAAESTRLEGLFIGDR